MNQDESSWGFVVEIIFYRVSMLLCGGTVPIPCTAMLINLHSHHGTKTKEKEKKEGTVISNYCVYIEKTKNGKQKFCTIQ